MPVIINFKICDNAKECGGIEACDYGALYWSEEENKIIIDNSKCKNCFACVDECPVGAIQVAQNQEEYDRIKLEIENDYRLVEDLFVDRYGAIPIDDKRLVEIEKLDSIISNSKNILIVELFNDDSINCLLNSIPIKVILAKIEKDSNFIKAEIQNDLFSKYDVFELPALLIFDNGIFVDKISGYYEISQQDKLFSALNKILKER